jgi:predicted nucleic acid-binding protein
MVAAVCTWHEHHEPARDEIDDRLRRREALLVAAPALVEAYAVLTRLPPPHRLSPSDALALLEANFLRGKRVLGLSGRTYRELLRSAPERRIVGGRVYDAVIVECAVGGAVNTLLTFNERDFLPLAPPGLEIVVPGRAGVGSTTSTP